MNMTIRTSKSLFSKAVRKILVVASFVFLISVVPTGALKAMEALKVPDAPELYRRVLILPEAKIQEQPGEEHSAEFSTLPVFSVRYIYGEKQIDGEGWLEIGREPVGGGDGWLKTSFTEAWKSMLVMQFSPRGQRKRVLFFNEKEGLERSITAEIPQERFEELYTDIAEGRPDRGLLAAMEPQAAIDASSQPYLMPILDWAPGEYENGSEITMVQVAGLNAQTATGGAGNGAGGEMAAQPGAGAGEPALPGAGNEPSGDLSDFKMGIVFVIDTTQSMGPYIERTYDAVNAVYDQLAQDGTIEKASFGIVGYRDDVSYNNQIGYVTKVFQKLDPQAPREAVLENIRKVKAAKVSTEGWNEDAVAGLYEAINNMDWGPYAGRLIVLISDAGARVGTDPHAAHRNMAMDNIREMAAAKSIAIFPMHLRTDKAESAGNVPLAESQYRSLGTTGDVNVNKYVGVDRGELNTFSSFVGDFANQVRVSLRQANQGQTVTPDQLDDLLEQQDPFLDNFDNAPAPPEADNAENQPPEAPQTDMGRMAVNEIFRAQIEYIGARDGEQLPPFYRAWTSDRNLPNPQLAALSVNVFLSRNQLNSLAQSLREIVDQARAAELDPGNFFGLLQSLSATTSNDPNRNDGAFDNLAESGLLPTYLSQLPYRSKVLQLTQDDWLNWGMTGQLEFIDELELKLTMYQQMNDDTDRWVDFGSEDSGQAAYPVPLYALP
jgi:serine/threonine-protein kinase PpkA